ncbi:ATP synthase CF0 B subunit [Iris pallida]|uniref:ATP synthase CF0 B subunit (Plastid) n=1 Tax=Iris pallida TaxID=29817 RepID=A0AAX6H4Q4_IRIPA|nr:ATP synthase CF0 B subunit [Iris pallida]
MKKKKKTLLTIIDFFSLVGRVLLIFWSFSFDIFEYEQKREDRLITLKDMGMPIR